MAATASSVVVVIGWFALVMAGSGTPTVATTEAYGAPPDGIVVTGVKLPRRACDSRHSARARA